MIQKIYVFILISISFCVTIHAAPVLSNITANSSSVERYGKFELTFNLSATYTNPFDSDEIRVDAIFTSPSGRTLVQPGFFFREYERSLSAGASQILDPVVGSDCWKIRFTPQELGTYTYILSATDSTGQVTLPAQTFTCLTSSRKGFVRADGYRLVFDDGSPYFPIGASVSWSQPFSDEHRYYKWGYGYDSTYGFDASFAEYNRYGGNWDRLWVDTGDWATPCIEGRKSYWNIYPWQLEDTFGHTGNNCGRIENFADLRPYRAQPYELVDGDTLSIRVNGSLNETITFYSADFAAIGADIASATVGAVAAVFNSKAHYASMLPQLHNGLWYARIRAHPAAADVNSLEVTGGTAASMFNFPTTVARPSMTVELRYKESSGGWRVEEGKTYRFSGWVKTANLQAGTGGGANFKTQYFQSPILSGTQDWTYWETIWTAPKHTRLNLICTVSNAGGRAWFDDFSLLELSSGLEMGQDGGFEFETLVINRYNLPDAWALDYILGIAEQYGIYIQLMIGRHGQPDASYQKYLRYLVGRWGYSPHVLSWEFENENWHDMAWHHRMSLHLESIDVHNHLRTTSLWSGLVDPNLWGLPGLTLVNLHHYRKDAYTPRIWGMLENDARLDRTVYHSSNTSLKMTPGAWGPNGPFMDITPGESYTLSYWVKGDGVDADATAIQVYYVDKNHNEFYGAQPATKKGTYDWTQASVSFTAPANAVLVRFFVQIAGLRSGTVWFDDFKITRNSDAVDINWTDFEFANYRRFEDWAHYGFSDGKLMRSYYFNKPNIGGEHGIEHVTGYFLQSPHVNGKDNGVTDMDLSDPSFQWDQAGIHFHNWLWGTAMGGMSGATGMWWYVNDSHRHYLALSRFIAASRADFVNLESYKSTTPGDPIQSSNPSVWAFGKRDLNNAYLYLLNENHTWDRWIRDGIAPSPQDATVTVKGLNPGSYRIEWWDTYYVDTTLSTSPVLRTEILSTDAGGKLNLTVTGLTSDTAVKIDPVSGPTPSPQPTQNNTPQPTRTLTSTPTATSPSVSTPTPTRTPTASPTSTPVQAASTPTRTPTSPAPIGGLNNYRITAGGSGGMDDQGEIWSSDQDYASGGYGYVGGSTYSTTHVIGGTANPSFYQNERYGMSAYRFDLSPGDYTVKLCFAEIYFDGITKGGAGSRLFDVSIENKKVLDRLDIFALAGHDQALDFTFLVTVNDGVLDIEFTPIQENPKISAIAVSQYQTPVTTPTSPPTATATERPTSVPATRTATPVPPTVTPSRTATPIPPTATRTRTATPIPPTATPTRTATPVPPTATPTRTATPVPPTATPTRTATPVPPTATPTRTATPVQLTATPTSTPTAAPSTQTPTKTATLTPEPANTPIPTRTHAPSRTPEPTRTPLPTRTVTPTFTSSPTRTPTNTRTPTAIPSTPTTVATRTPTAVATPTLTTTPSATWTSVPSSTPTRTQTPVPTPTRRPWRRSVMVLDQWGVLYLDDGYSKTTSQSMAAVPWWKAFKVDASGEILGMLSWGSVLSLHGNAEVFKIFLGWDFARDFETVNGGVAVMDGFGTIHTTPGTPATDGLPCFNWDIARDLELSPKNHFYYILSGYGTLHTNDPAGSFVSPNYGWDIARDFEILPDGSGGYILDGLGGVMPVGAAPSIPAPYFGWDIAKDLELAPEGDGFYILDAFGGIHTCGNASPVTGWNFNVPLAVDMNIQD